MIVSQPANVISEVLPTDQRVEEVGDHQHRDDETEEVGAAHVRDEETERCRAHIRSIPSIRSSRIANIAIPITMATTSMAALLTSGHHGRMTIGDFHITISLRPQRHTQLESLNLASA